MLLYEMNFFVPNYSCLQNPWLGGYHPQIPILCPQLNLLNPSPKKFLGTPLVLRNVKCIKYTRWLLHTFVLLGGGWWWVPSLADHSPICLHLPSHTDWPEDVWTWHTGRRKPIFCHFCYFPGW